MDPRCLPPEHAILMRTSQCRYSSADARSYLLRARHRPHLLHVRPRNRELVPRTPLRPRRTPRHIHDGPHKSERACSQHRRGACQWHWPLHPDPSGERNFLRDRGSSGWPSGMAEERDSPALRVHRVLHGHLTSNRIRELPASRWMIRPDEGIRDSRVRPSAAGAGWLGARGHRYGDVAWARRRPRWPLKTRDSLGMSIAPHGAPTNAVVNGTTGV